MKKAVTVVLLLIAIAAAGAGLNNQLYHWCNVEEAIPGSPVDVMVYEEVYERPAGYWEFYRLIYDLGVTPSEVDPESIRVMVNGVDVTEEVKIKLVEEDPVYRMSINRYWEPGEYNVTMDVSDYAGNRAIYKTVLIFT